MQDPTPDLVIAELHHRGVPVVQFDAGDLSATLSRTARAGAVSAGRRGSPRTPTRPARPGPIRALYCRRPAASAFPHLDSQDASVAAAQVRRGPGGVPASLPGCLYVNHPHRIGDAEYKPAALAAAAACGFRLPPTVITNEPDRVRAFVRAHGPVTHQLISVPTHPTVPVAAVAAGEVDRSPSGTTHLFQQRIDKVADVRVTVIGDRIFAVRIDSGLPDWRTDHSTHTYAAIPVPDPLVRAILAYLRHFGLVFGAFDFALTGPAHAADSWVWIECHPSGQWSWLEPPTGLPMTSALADLLERGTP
ncbi:ATP-grasp ribosomal peptide maturase [Kitasatospora griseola]|uniref:ATP-grasp ribosomal peptide maturase n=1 Tax=Kitasatospora griseola TaxID=2064 RepID=UPI003431B982